MDETLTPVDENKKNAVSDKSQKDWTMVTHLSGLVSFVGIPGIVGPLVAWLVKKDEMPRVDFAGKEAINFHLTMLIVAAISGALTVILIGFVGLIVVWLFSIIFPIVAAIKANEGEDYVYPFSWRLIT